jgi:hypothetical protein
VGAPPVAVGVLPKALGVAAVSAGAGDRAGAGRGRVGDEPVAVPRPLAADGPEAAPDVVHEDIIYEDIAYESGEPSVSADDRPLSYVPFYGVPYVPLPTVNRHRMRVRS